MDLKFELHTNMYCSYEGEGCRKEQQEKEGPREAEEDCIPLRVLFSAKEKSINH